MRSILNQQVFTWANTPVFSLTCWDAVVIYY